jgi:adenosylmethionine-8-amino-7-oxononanoate aminotransferase
MEGAMMLAIQFHRERGQDSRVNIIGRMQSYHGTSLETLAMGYHGGRREKYERTISEWPNFHHVSACNPYRGKRDEQTDDEYTDELIKELETKIQELGHHTVAAFVMEPVVGAVSVMIFHFGIPMIPHCTLFLV